MFKRFSFRKSKKEGENGAVLNGNGSNGSNIKSNGATNGEANGANGHHTYDGYNDSNGKTNPRPMKQPSRGVSKEQESSFSEPDHSVTRGDVDSAFEQFAQLVSASRRPLPTQTGDGSYLEHEVPSSLFQELKTLGFKDMKTLKETLVNKASGALNDDKTMLMERVIQVERTPIVMFEFD